MKQPKVDSIVHTEKSYQSAIVELATVHGWHVQHTLPTQIRPGVWRTHIQGHTGFPDLVLAHPRYGVLFVEVKTIRGRLSDAQKSWISTLRSAGAEAHVWRPEDWSYVQQRLAGIVP